MKKGIFWHLSKKSFIIVSVACDENGKAEKQAVFSSKSGNNFNHKAEWAKLSKRVTKGRPYNYYPRGRVEIYGKSIKIFLNTDINRKEIIEEIIKRFDLSDTKKEIKIINDGSSHYRYIKNMSELN